VEKNRSSFQRDQKMERERLKGLHQRVGEENLRGAKKDDHFATSKSASDTAKKDRADTLWRADSETKT